MSNKFNWKSFSGVFLALFFLFGAVIPEAGARVPLPGTEAAVSLVWAKSYDVPNFGVIAVVPDNKGNVYALGNSYSNDPVHIPNRSIIVKYSSSGQIIWDRGPNDIHVAKGMVVDNQGNVYITGNNEFEASFYTVKYDPDGHLLWQRKYAGQSGVFALTLDENGNVFVAGYTFINNFSCSLIVKYGPNGEELWASQYRGSQGNTAYAIVTDQNGNVYVTGAFIGDSFYNVDYLTIKYNPEGQKLWAKRYNGGNDHDCAETIAVDGDGNVVVVGNSRKDNAWGYVAIKYNSDGNQLWTRRFLRGNGQFYKIPIILDSKGDVYFAVNEYVFQEKPYRANIALVKFSSAGQHLWTRRHYGPEETDVFVGAMAADNQDNLYITGHVLSGLAASSYSKCLTLKYNNEGNKLWQRGFGESAEGKSIAVDSQHNIYVGERNLIIKYAETP